MNGERWQRAKELFNHALAQTADEQFAFLASACAEDDDLRREVESLLAAYRRADKFIEMPVVEDVLRLVDSNRRTMPTGRRIGQYAIIRKLGDGGMGAVYLAARADDQYQKEVAIKMIKFGPDSEFIVNRFLSERQILANLDHPNIGRMIDGGTTDAGSPYLVMEYIDGRPIDEYCAEQGLSTAARLRLFRAVCSAVQYAHSHLIVHRDIKPSNILVTREGIPKLLDFGIAKLLGLDPAAQVIGKTATAIRMMTPDYASPEQVRGADITTASDVYGLGIVLYELLTGHRPHRLKSRSPEEIARAICEEEPEAPSTALGRADAQAVHRGVQRSYPAGLAVHHRSLRGDIDNIVLMALRKEPQRRYESVAQFSADVQRHLDGLPVMARKDTFKYRASKFARRNRVGVAAAAIVLLSLLAGFAATAWQARATRREKANAERIVAFLADVLNSSNPILSAGPNSGRETTMTEALDNAAKRLGSGELANQPDVKAELERIIAKSYYGQGRYALGAQHLEEYVSLERRLYGERHPKTLSALTMWGSLLFLRGRLAEAERLYRDILPAMRPEQRKGTIETDVLLDAVTNFAYLRRTQGDSKEAEALFREALALNAQLPVEARIPMALTRSTLASSLADQGKFGEALQTAREAVDELRQAGQNETPDFGFSLTVLGGFLGDKGDFPQADAALRDAEAIFRRRFKSSHLWLGDNLRNQAISYYRQERFAEAESRVTEALEIYRESFGVHYDNYPTALITQGLILDKTGRSTEGEAILREAVRIRTASLPKEHFWVALANDALGECLTTQRRFAEAEPLLTESYATLNATLGNRDSRTIEALRRLVRLYQLWDKPALAAQYRTLL